MPHFGSKVKIKRKTADEWLGVSSQMGELVNSWSGRSDLVAFVGEGAGQGVAPALFDPAKAEIEVNIEMSFGNVTPEQVGDIRQRSVQFENAKGAGAVFHEAMHAKYTTWDLEQAAKDLTGSENRAMHNLEESRMEGFGVRAQPHNKPLLKACVLEIVLSDMTDEASRELSSVRQAAQLAALALARVDTGVLTDDDVLATRAQVEEKLGKELLDKLEDIWIEFQRTDAKNVKKLYKLAREWDKLVQDEAEEQGEGGAESDPANGGGGRELTEEEAQAIQEMMDALGDDAEATSISAAGDVADQETREEWEEQAKAKAKDGKEREKHQEQSAKVFGQSTGPAGNDTASTLKEVRNPTGDERAAAVKVARELEKAKYRNRSETKRNSIIPPGKLRARTAMQGAAYAAQNIRTEIQPWKRTVRKQTEEPKLTIGCMVDISGSMSAAMEPMAVTAWVLSEAIRRVEGRTAMVYYGNDVFPTLKPGQHLDQVHVYTAPDGTERFDRAFQALDGGLDLLRGTGARMLVVCSDGCYTSNEQEAVKNWLERCQRAGVAVLWIGFGNRGGYDRYAEEYCERTDAVYISAGSGITGAAMKIGAAAAQALTIAGNRQAY